MKSKVYKGQKEMMLSMEEILRMEMSASHWNGFFEWNDLK